MNTDANINLAAKQHITIFYYNRFFDAQVFQVRAIGGLEILIPPLILVEAETAVAGGNQFMREDKIAARVPPDYDFGKGKAFGTVIP